MESQKITRSPNEYLNPKATAFWEMNAIASGIHHRYCAKNHIGTLSIKTMLKGTGVWTTPGRTFKVEPQNFLVINRGQTYGVDVDSVEPSQTFAIFFRPGLAEEIVTFITDQHLTEIGKDARDFGFYERLSLKDERMQFGIQKLRQILYQVDVEAWEIEEAFMSLAETLVANEIESKLSRDRLDLVKSSVREEIYRQLLLSRDFMLSESHQAIDLHSLANIATLSPYYFHRLFLEAFGKTPHDFLTEVRIARAKILLETSDMPIWQVSLDIGFQSPSHFCRLYRKLSGESPSTTKQKVQDRARPF